MSFVRRVLLGRVVLGAVMAAVVCGIAYVSFMPGLSIVWFAVAALAATAVFATLMRPAIDNIPGARRLLFIQMYGLALIGLMHYIPGALIVVALTIPSTVMNDVGGLVVGRKFKDHEFWGECITPDISPKKTRAGYVGSYFGGVLGFWIAYAILQAIWPDEMPSLVFLASGAATIPVVSVLGDLAGSVPKRALEKLGRALPSNLGGHGNVLDRTDSQAAANGYAITLNLMILWFTEIISWVFNLL